MRAMQTAIRGDSRFSPASQDHLGSAPVGRDGQPSLNCYCPLFLANVHLKWEKLNELMMTYKYGQIAVSKGGLGEGGRKMLQCSCATNLLCDTERDP